MNPTLSNYDLKLSNLFVYIKKKNFIGEKLKGFSINGQKHAFI